MASSPARGGEPHQVREAIRSISDHIAPYLRSRRGSGGSRLGRCRWAVFPPATLLRFPPATIRLFPARPRRWLHRGGDHKVLGLHGGRRAIFSSCTQGDARQPTAENERHADSGPRCVADSIASMHSGGSVCGASFARSSNPHVWPKRPARRQFQSASPSELNKLSCTPFHRQHCCRRSAIVGCAGWADFSPT